MYSSIAERTPPLAPGLTALDLVRETLDRYLDGYHSVGMEGFCSSNASPGFMDSYPSLLIAATDYARASKDEAWIKQNYAGLKHWAALMLAKDTDGDGSIEYLESGNFNSWPARRRVCVRRIGGTRSATGTRTPTRTRSLIALWSAWRTGADDESRGRREHYAELAPKN